MKLKSFTAQAIINVSADFLIDFICENSSCEVYCPKAAMAWVVFLPA